MASRPNYSPAEKSLAQLFAEFKDELKEFGATRLAIFRAEMGEKKAMVLVAFAAIAAGAVLALLAVFFLCVALVGVVAMLLGGGAGAWAAGSAIVGGIFLLAATLAIMLGVRRLKGRGLKPERTLRVLKQDQIWFRNESRSAR